MPSESCTLPDIEQTVARPAIYHVLDQLFDITRLSKDTQIYFPGPSGQMHVPGSVVNEDGRAEAKFQADRYTFVEVEEEYDQDAVQETMTHHFDQVPVFKDTALRLSIRPIYTTSKVKLNIRYRSTSETECRRWMAEMYQRCSRGRDMNLHEIRYTYPLPMPFLAFLKDAWGLREAVAGYGDTFQQYFTSHATSRLTMLANDAGEHLQLVISEKQSEIVGQFDFTVVPEKPQRQSDSATWEINFSYSFSYQRPDSVYLHYPISVHNQLLPTKYLKHLNQEIDYEIQDVYRSRLYSALHEFSLDTAAMRSRPPDAYIRIPAFDDFKAETTLPGSATIFTALCLLEDDRRTLLNLNELGDVMLDLKLVPYLQGEVPYLTKPYHSLLNLSLYRFDDPQVETSLEVLPDLTVRATRDLDPRAVYHVRFAAITQIHLVVEAAFDRLLAHPDAFVKMMSSLNDLLRLNPDFQQWNRKHKIEAWEMKRVYQILTGYQRGNLMQPQPALAMPYYDNIPRWPGKARAQFLPEIDDRTVQRYFAGKRRHLNTVQAFGIVVHPKPTQAT